MRVLNMLLAVMFSPLLVIGYVVRVAVTMFLAGWLMATDSLDETASGLQTWNE